MGNSGLHCVVVGAGIVGVSTALFLARSGAQVTLWSYLPKIAPWLRRYLGNANDKDTQRISEQLAFIVSDSVEQHQDLAGNTEADKWLQPSDYQFAYRTMADFEADHYVWSIRSRLGFEPELVTGDAVREKEPALGSETDVLAVLKNHGHIKSPGLYVKSLAKVFEIRTCNAFGIRAWLPRDFQEPIGKCHSAHHDFIR